MNTDPARIPVIIGVGQINDRACTHDSLGLMPAALVAADEDAGDGWLARLESVATVDALLGALRKGASTTSGGVPKTPSSTSWS